MQIFAKLLGPLLGYIYSMVSNYPLSIVLFTIFIKVLLMPLTYKQIKSMKDIQKIQPELQKIQDKYKNDKEMLNVKTMELYKEYKVNPFDSCLPMVIQLPILMGMYISMQKPMLYVFNTPALQEVGKLALSQTFFWVHNLSAPDSMHNIFANMDFMKSIPGILPILASVLTYFQTKTMGNTGGQDNQTMRTMNIMMPLMILYFGITMSAGLMLYWVVSTLFQIVQQVLMTRLTREG